VTDLFADADSRRWLRRPRRPRLLRGRRRQARLIDGISFTIAPGEAAGYVGASEAGNSAMVKLITGACAPAEGTIRTCGLTPVAEREQLAHRVGVMSGRQSHLWPNLSLDEAFHILARAHGRSEKDWLARRTDLVDRLELAAFVTMPVERLSRGRRIRAEVAAALIHEPELLILDEPMLGLDVIGKERMRSFLRQENRVHGRTLLFAAGDLVDVEQICHRVLVLDHGRLVHDGDLSALISRAGVQRTLVVDLVEADRRLDDVPGAKLIAVEAGGLRQRLTFIPGSVPAAQVLAEVAARSGIRHLTLEEPDLETLISRL
jgi:ABC-2 type transport system ATP-binding protein